jgi:penicillin-binding protein 1A
MGDSWGQGARNALLIVGDFFQHASKAKLVDTKAKFSAPHDNSQPDADAVERMREWWAGMTQAAQQQQSATEITYDPAQVRAPVIVPAPLIEAPAVVGRVPRGDATELGGPPYRPSLEPAPLLAPPPPPSPAPSPEPRQEAQQGIPILRAY